MKIVALLALVSLASLVPTTAADLACTPGAQNACVVAASYAGGGPGPCDGSAYNGGYVGVVQNHGDGSNTFAGVMNQCYSGTDAQGRSYHGTTIGVYIAQNSPDGGSAEGFHLNTGENSGGRYCFLGEPDPVSPKGVSCPALIDVPMLLSALP